MSRVASLGVTICQMNTTTLAPLRPRVYVDLVYLSIGSAALCEALIFTAVLQTARRCTMLRRIGRAVRPATHDGELKRKSELFQARVFRPAKPPPPGCTPQRTPRGPRNRGAEGGLRGRSHVRLAQTRIFASVIKTLPSKASRHLEAHER